MKRMSFKKPFFLFNLANGLKAVFWPVKGIETVVTELWIRAGGCYETKIKRGVFHFLEHVLAHGSQKYPSFGRLVDREEELGLVIKDSVSGLASRFNLTIPKETFSDSIQFLSEYIFNPIFSTGGIERERRIILQEYFRYWDDYTHRFHQKVAKGYWGEGHPYTFDALGEKETIESITKEDLKTAHQKYFVPGNMLLVIVGDLDPRLIEAELRKNFGQGTKGNLPTLMKHYPPSNKKNLIFHEEKIDQIVFDARFPLFEFDKNDWIKRYTGLMISRLLGGWRGSRLTRFLREKEPLAYSAGSSFYFRPPQGGMISVDFSSSLENAGRIVEVFREQIEKIKKEGFTDEELSVCQRYLEYRVALSNDTIYSIANNLMDDLFWLGKIYLPNDLRLKIKSVTKKDLKSACDDIFDFNKATIGFMGNKSNVKQIKEKKIDKVL